jgi:uncharacterized membrane protein (Fun14 family)
MSTISIWSPLIAQFGVGGIGGLCVGFALKKVAKIVAFVIGIFFIIFQYLAYKGIISIHYGTLMEWARGIAGSVGAAEGVLTGIIVNLPFASSFIVGFGVGLKMG